MLLSAEAPGLLLDWDPQSIQSSVGSFGSLLICLFILLNICSIIKHFSLEHFIFQIQVFEQSKTLSSHVINKNLHLLNQPSQQFLNLTERQ